MKSYELVSYELFKKFIKYHYPNFSEARQHFFEGARITSFCQGTLCCECEVRKICTQIPAFPGFTAKQLIKIKEIYPEYLI